MRVHWHSASQAHSASKIEGIAYIRRLSLSVSNPKICILLATRNGAEFLQQQLDSFRAQTYGNWELLASDDGSTDATRDILARFAASVTQRVVLVAGPQQGFWQNFASLVRRQSDADLLAYSDQDDVWFAEKLQKAVDWLQSQKPDIPALYFTRTELIAVDGTKIGLSPLFTRPPSFRNALVQSIGGGNTMVFNAAARHALCATPEDAAVVSHDWWTYQIVTGVGGVAHYDAWPSLQYRQHPQNLVGGNVGIRAKQMRLFAFAGGRFVAWNDVNLALLNAMRNALTSDSLVALDRFTKARRAPLPARLWLLYRSGVHRQSWIENVGLVIGALLGRV